MNMTDVFNGIGDFFMWSFKLVHKAGNAPNIFFWLVIIGLIITWLTMQRRFNKEAKEKNTLQ